MRFIDFHRILYTVDIEKRMHGTPIGKMCTKEPTKEQVDAFRCIGREYWCKIFNDFKRL